MAEILTEITPIENGACIYLVDREKESFSFPIHKHDEVEINFIENCEGGKRIVGDSIEDTVQYDLVLIGSGLEHAWVQPSGVEMHNMREITIQFKPGLIALDMMEKDIFSSIKDLYERSKYGIAFGQNTIMRVYYKLDQLAREEKSFKRYLSLLEILYMLSQSKDYHMLSSTPFAQAPESNDSRRIRKVMDYIAEHYNEDIHQPELAEMIGMTPSAFSRFFTQHVGKPMSDYLVDYRLGRAARLLVDSSQSVVEICYDCGFNSISNFNRLFKKRKGCNPSDFRQNYKKHKVIL